MILNNVRNQYYCGELSTLYRLYMIVETVCQPCTHYVVIENFELYCMCTDFIGSLLISSNWLLELSNLLDFYISEYCEKEFCSLSKLCNSAIDSRNLGYVTFGGSGGIQLS